MYLACAEERYFPAHDNDTMLWDVLGSSKYLKLSKWMDQPSRPVEEWSRHIHPHTQTHAHTPTHTSLKQESIKSI